VRLCIGRQYALDEVAIALATIASEVELTSSMRHVPLSPACGFIEWVGDRERAKAGIQQLVAD
jgi:hypothetical protein